MKTKIHGVFAGLLLSFAALPASALDILLTNDDGFETPYIQVLYTTLVAAGHHVVMSAPYLGQSGSGGEVTFLQPIQATSEPSEGGLIPAGSPGVGQTTIAAFQYYVDGSPVDALMYGIDVASPAVFGRWPDLVISGPNEGNNTGLNTPHSGTLGAAVAALNKGIPAIAVSAGRLDGTPGEPELIAALTLKVVASVDGRHGIRLPEGIGLNVNIPDVDVVPATDVKDEMSFELTRVGIASVVGYHFYEDIGDSAIANIVGIPPGIGLPGLSVDRPYTAAGYPEDRSRRSEQNALDDLTVTVSAIQGTYAADRHQERRVRSSLKSLFHPKRSGRPYEDDD
ncbi:MAG: 5'/3'-nucleotidase SurE [Halioglobus sp.]|nr:5'/3'-nucleotidase SurE [Halioglobus sp.]